MSRFDQLIDFLLSVPAMILIGGGVFCFLQGIRHIWVRWAMFGGTMYVASLAKYFDPWEERLWDPFNPPIEMLVMNGRPLAVVMLGFLILLAMVTRKERGHNHVPAMMWPIHAMQCLILVKVVSANGLSAHAVQAALIFICIGLVTAVGLRNWIWRGNAVEMLALALCVASGLFAIIVGWHLRTNPSAIFSAGRLMGTTANAQHAAVLLGLGFLGPAYILITFKERKNWQVIAAGGLGLALLYLLMLTGSRTGVGLILIGMVCLFRGRFGAAAVVGVVAAGVGFVVLQQIGEQANVERLVRTDDTRSEVWLAQWNTFQRFPVFGAPQRGEQFRTAENSWLGLLAAAGVFGGTCLLWLLYEFGRAASALWRLRMRADMALQVNFCLAGIGTVLAGSFFEAYLFGIITFPILFIAALSLVCENTIQSGYSYPVVAEGEHSGRARLHESWAVRQAAVDDQYGQSPRRGPAGGGRV